MSIKVPTNHTEDPSMHMAERYPHEDQLGYKIVNQTNKDVLIKRNAFNTTIPGITIGDQDSNCIKVHVTFGLTVTDLNEFEVETPFDALLMDMIHEHDGKRSALFGSFCSTTVSIGIAKHNLPEFVGPDGGIHSRLLGFSLYGFDGWEEKDLIEPGPFTNKELCDEHGNKISKNQYAQIIYEYINNTEPDLILFTPVGNQIIKLVPKQDPTLENQLRIHVQNEGKGKMTTYSYNLPDSRVDLVKFHKALEEYDLHLNASNAMESYNSKSLLRMQSIAKEQNKEIERLNNQLVKLEDSKGKLKEANSKQQLKHEQSSIWTKLFESIIKVPFSIIASLLERKLTTVLAARLFAALI
ncbi:hypothetical protein [Vibrio phage phiKT1028]|nr:hypothetical protein [Vibrio phage phiKT1028]